MASVVAKRVGFLATGTEITTGEILNTNSQNMAQTLLEHGVPIGEHIICDDEQNNIVAALNYMISRHDALIITGGLGPTSDDRTRNALAEATKVPLVFHEPSWRFLTDRIKRYRHDIPESNRRQAFFPQGSQILTNHHGTASGCMLSFEQTLIFLLPGPPRECIPLFHSHILPTLSKFGFLTEQRLHRWIITGVPEAQIAEQLDTLGEKYGVNYGYRASKPVIHVKLVIAPSHPEYHEIINATESIVRAYLVNKA